MSTEALGDTAIENVEQYSIEFSSSDDAVVIANDTETVLITIIDQTTDVFVINFSIPQYSVREEEGVLTLCLEMLVAPHTRERNVTLDIFSIDGTATSEDDSLTIGNAGLSK